MDKVLAILAAIAQLAPAVMPLVKQLWDAIMGHELTPEERAQISARLDAAIAMFNASVARRNAEEEAGGTS